MAINAEDSQLKKANAGATGGSVVSPSTGASQAPQAQGRVANYSTGSTAGPSTQGSGRFTNIQKYIGANQGAGEQLGGKITGDVSKNLQKTDKEQQSQASQIASNVQAEKDRLAKGVGYNEQLKDQTASGAQAIAGDQNTAQEFSNLVNNQNVASNLATTAQTQADAAQAAYNNLGTQVGNLGTEAGRFALLQQAVKNPQYTQGQQRLDQLFLQASNPNQLVQAQRDLNKQLGTSTAAMGNTYGQLGNDISAVGTQAADVANMLRGTLGTETQNLIDAQSAEAQGLNTSNAAANAALQTYFTNGYGSLTDAQKAVLDPMLASGNLTTGMRTYNVLSDPQSYQNYITQGQTNLTGADVLDQNEYNRYAALQSLAGLDPSQNIYSQAGAGGVASALQGEKLASDIQAERTALENQFNKTFQNQGSLTNKAQANFLDLMKYLEDPTKISNGHYMAPGNASPIQIQGEAGPNWGNALMYKDPVTGRFVANTSVGTFGGNDAIAGLLQQYIDQLAQAGYGNALGTGGTQATNTYTWK